MDQYQSSSFRSRNTRNTTNINNNDNDGDGNSEVSSLYHELRPPAQPPIQRQPNTRVGDPPSAADMIQPEQQYRSSRQMRPTLINYREDEEEDLAATLLNNSKRNLMDVGGGQGGGGGYTPTRQQSQGRSVMSSGGNGGARSSRSMWQQQQQQPSGPMYGSGALPSQQYDPNAMPNFSQQQHQPPPFMQQQQQQPPPSFSQQQHQPPPAAPAPSRTNDSSSSILGGDGMGGSSATLLTDQPRSRSARYNRANPMNSAFDNMETVEETETAAPPPVSQGRRALSHSIQHHAKILEESNVNKTELKDPAAGDDEDFNVPDVIPLSEPTNIPPHQMMMNPTNNHNDPSNNNGNISNGGNGSGSNGFGGVNFFTPPPVSNDAYGHGMSDFPPKGIHRRSFSKKHHFSVKLSPRNRYLACLAIWSTLASLATVLTFGSSKIGWGAETSSMKSGLTAGKMGDGAKGFMSEESKVFNNHPVFNFNDEKTTTKMEDSTDEHMSYGDDMDVEDMVVLTSQELYEKNIFLTNRLIEYNFEDLTTSARKVVHLNNIPYFFYIPKGGGGVFKWVSRQCLNLVEASAEGYDFQGQASLQVLLSETTPPFKFVNVDVTTEKGISRAQDLELAKYPRVQLFYSPLFHQSATIFTPSNKGIMFALFEHPVPRAANLFTELQNYDPSIASMDMEEFVASGKLENNWMTRFLVDKPGGELTPHDLHQACEILRRKCLVGLATRLEESLHRFGTYMNWEMESSQAKGCVHEISQKYNTDGALEFKQHVWEGILAQNNFDILVYEYVEVLFEEQKSLF